MERKGICGVCGIARDRRVLREARELDLAVAARIEQPIGALREDAVVCPLCVGNAVSLLAEARGEALLHDHIQASWPIDPGTTYGVLPVPLRLHANPLYRGKGVVMAFLDSGYYAHPDLVGRRNRVRTYVDATTSSIAQFDAVKPAGPLSWHGLMTTSVAAGDGSCSGGRYRGLASEAELVLVKITDPEGGVHDVDIERGLVWLRRHHRRYGIRVLNLSVGGDEERSFKDSPVDQLVSALVREGITVVCAAGNSGQRRLVPPASAPSAITVGGLDDQNLTDPAAYRIWHSNYGPTVDGVVKPELVAPSIWVAAPILPGSEQIPQAEALDRLANAPAGEAHALFRRLGKVAGLDASLADHPAEAIGAAARKLQVEEQYLEAAYKRVEGTSFAAPIVSSTVATMLEANPSLTPRRVKQLLLRTAEQVPGVETERQGCGVVDPREAVARALREPGGVLEGLPMSPDLREDGGATIIAHARQQEAVAVVGDFNGWDPTVHPCVELRPEVFAAEVRGLSAGDRYQLLLDDGTLLEDTDNPRRAPDGFGGWVSKI